MPEIIKKIPNKYNTTYGNYFIVLSKDLYLTKGGKVGSCNMFGNNYAPFYFKTLSAAKSALRAYQKRVKQP